MLIMNLPQPPGGRGATRILVFYTSDKRFSKHTLIANSHPGKTPPNWEFRAILPPNKPLNKLFWRHVWWSLKTDPKTPLDTIQKDPFSRNRHILSPNRDLRLASKHNPFYVFLWSCMCTTLLFESPPGLSHEWWTYNNIQLLCNKPICNVFHSVITWFKPAGPKTLEFKGPLVQKYGALFRTHVFPIQQDPLVQKSKQVC